MRSTQQFSVTLPNEMAQMVKAKVASGEYATESEVIRDGLRTLVARDAALEKGILTEAAGQAETTMASLLGAFYPTATVVVTVSELGDELNSPATCGG